MYNTSVKYNIAKFNSLLYPLWYINYKNDNTNYSNNRDGNLVGIEKVVS